MNYTKPLKFSNQLESQIKKSDCKFVITGGSGWIGRATISMLKNALQDNFEKRVTIFSSSGNHINFKDGRIETMQLRSIKKFKVDEAYLIHLAFLTKEQAVGSNLNDYIISNKNISDSVISFAKNNQIAGVFLPSSGAVYRADGELEDDIKKNPYGYLKALDENRFNELNIDSNKLSLARIFNLSGPFMNKASNYALGSIIKDINAGGPIRIDSDYPVFRSYINVVDLVEISFQIMLGTIQGPSIPFDTGTDEIIEIGELANKCLHTLGRDDIEIIRPHLDQTKEPNYYIGNPTTFSTLSKKAEITISSIEDQITDTSLWLSENDEEKYT